MRKDITVEEAVRDGEEEEEESGGVEEDEKKKKKGGGVSRRRRSSGGGRVYPPCCRAESCGADLTVAKRYHRRHKVCELHSKEPVVVVAGLRQRFCQKCSRFHELAEFDEAKRSCRRRLARHNEQRRRKSTTSAAAGGARNEGSSTGIISIKGQDHPLERHFRDNNNNADDWRRIQMNMARGSGYYKFFHFR